MTIQQMIARQQEIVSAARSAGRALTPEEQSEFERLQADIESARAVQDSSGNEPDADEAARQAVAADRQRMNEIAELCRQVGMDSHEYIQSDTSIDDVRRAAVEFLIQNGAPVGGRMDDGQDNQFQRAAADALLMQAGISVQDPPQAVNDLRGLSLRDMMVECLTRSGEGSTVSLLRRSKNELWDEAVRQFLSPTAAFPAILDSAIQKALVHQYQLVPTTFDLWTSKGSLTDFKQSKLREYSIGGGKFHKVPEGGELKHSTLDTELNPTRQLETYGMSFTMTREAFINDDIGFLAEMPAQYARVAKRTINKQVYEMLATNPAIYDGAALFDANAHSNLIATGSAPSVDSIQKMMLKLLRQKDPFGESIMVQPKFIIVPVGYGFLLSQLLETREIDVSGIGSHTANALYNYRNQLQVIEEGAINALAGENAVPWFIVGDKTTAKSIQVDYFNGVETPSFRRSEKAGYLGFVWDAWLDWVVTPVDFRGIVRNNGTVISD
jgi:hypothetical protein